MHVLTSLAAAQPPVDTMGEDQEVSADQCGNNASVDAGNVVVPGDDSYPISVATHGLLLKFRSYFLSTRQELGPRLLLLHLRFMKHCSFTIYN
jgi:hypothetical protein